MAEVDLNALARPIQRLQGSVDVMRREQGRMADDISMIKADLQGVHGDISTLRADFLGLRHELRGEIASVRDEVASVRSEIVSLRSEIAGVRQDMRARFDALDARLRPLEDAEHSLGKPQTVREASYREWTVNPVSPQMPP